MKTLDARRLGLVASALITLTITQLGLLGVARWTTLAAGLLFNLCVLGSYWLLFEACAQRLGRSTWLIPLFYLPIVALTGLVLAHTWFFDVAIERRLTVLNMTLAGTRYFFEGALPPQGRWLFVGFYVVMFALAWWLTRGPLSQVPSRWLRWVTLPLLLGLFLSTRAERVASPLFDSTYELWELATRPRVQPTKGTPDPRLLASLDKSAITQAAPPTRYKKVIVLVMETMTAENFARESAPLPASTFVKSEVARTQRHERYFPNNQDSRTGMLDMLFSRLVPYEAYGDADHAHYLQLAKVPSLVDRMHALHYESAFVVSQTTLEDVVGELPWGATLHLSPADVTAAQQQKKLCFIPDEWETSCEDLVVLPRVLDFVSGHERAFVYQEFIWGHAAAYNDASGKSNAEYYSAYVDALRAGLATRGLLDDTLIVLTSDHGFRDKGRQHREDVYRMPLVFWASDMAAGVDTRLLSHTDFGLLLFERLVATSSRAPDNELVMIVGPTGQGNLFVVGRQGGHALLRHQAGLDLVIDQAGVVPAAPGALLSIFQAYRARFDAEMARVSGAR